MKTNLLLVANRIAVGLGAIVLVATVYSSRAWAQAPSIGGVKCSINGRPVSCDDGPSGGGSGGGGRRGPDVLDSLIDNVIGPLFGYSSPAEYARQKRAGDLTNEGVELSGKGDRRGALAKYREALTLDPSSKVIRFNIANNELYLAYEAGDLQLAIAKAREAITYMDSPGVREWLKYLEEKFVEQQRDRQADALNEEGRELWKKGDIKGALAKFQAASALSPSDTYRGNVALAEQRLVAQRANDQDVGTLRAAATAALTSLKSERSANVHLNLEAFRPGNPPPEEVAAYLAGQGSARGSTGPGHPAPAGDQLRSVEASGRSVAKTELGGSDAETNQQASGGARLGFDTPGQAAGSLPPVNLGGMRRSPDGAPIVPPERRTEAIMRLEAKRDQHRARRLELGQDISSLDTKLANPSLPGQERQTLLVKKAELKQEEFATRQEEITLNFSIELEDGKTIGQRTDANAVQNPGNRGSEPPSPTMPPTPGRSSPTEERRVRP